MEIAENLFVKSLDKLEEHLRDNFKLLSADIKMLSSSGLQQDTSAERSDLVQLLQYHDVIGQKIQHVKKINGIFDEEISNMHLEKGLNNVIPDLLLLMIKLTRFAKDEYTKVVARIRLNLSKLELNGGWNEVSFKLFYEEILFLHYKMEFFYEQVKEQFKSTGTDEAIIQQKLKMVYQSFSMDSEREIYRTVMGNHSDFPKEEAREEGHQESGHVDLF